MKSNDSINKVFDNFEGIWYGEWKQKGGDAPKSFKINVDIGLVSMCWGSWEMPANMPLDAAVSGFCNHMILGQKAACSIPVIDTIIFLFWGLTLCQTL